MRAQGYLSNHALNRFSEWKPGSRRVLRLDRPLVGGE
jgi:hypothetical protein